jgi:hypothetical protein
MVELTRQAGVPGNGIRGELLDAAGGDCILGMYHLELLRWPSAGDDAESAEKHCHTFNIGRSPFSILPAQALHMKRQIMNSGCRALRYRVIKRNLEKMFRIVQEPLQARVRRVGFPSQASSSSSCSASSSRYARQTSPFVTRYMMNSRGRMNIRL